MKPFRVSADYIDWAHSSAAEDGQPIAKRIDGATIYSDSRSAYKLFTDPVLVAEIADVAELYVIGCRGDKNLRAAGVLARAKKWLAEGKHDKRALLLAAHAEAG